MCEPPESRKVFHRRQLRKLSRAGEESKGQIFSLKNDPLATFVSFCWHEFGEALSMVPTPWRRRAPLSMTKRLAAVQFFCHSFIIRHFLFIRVIRGSACKRVSKSMHRNTSL